MINNYVAISLSLTLTLITKVNSEEIASQNSRNNTVSIQEIGPPLHPNNQAPIFDKTVNDETENKLVDTNSPNTTMYPEILNAYSDRDVEAYTFTTCGKTGRTGPSQTQVNNAYSQTPLDGQVTSSGGIQTWTVPSSGSYTIEAYGAQGGPGATYAVGNPGNGAYMKGTFDLNTGDILHILVGQKGSYTSYSNNYGGGGGGGTFVAIGSNLNVALPLIVAGGGGGGGYNSSSYVDGQTGNNGSNGGNASSNNHRGPGIGGSNGYGASGGTYGGNAGGFYSNGSGNYNYYSELGIGFRNGGNGGNGQYGGHGGFGGGGGGYGGAGGAGGYSGGGGGAWSWGGAGGGGGSYNSGTDQTNISGANSEHGIVIITPLEGASNSIPEALEQTVSLDEDETLIINLNGSDGDGDALSFATILDDTARWDGGTYSTEHGRIKPAFSSTLDFDGLNDVVIIPDGPAFDFGTGAFSVSAWFKKEGQGRGDIINMKGPYGDFGLILNSNETISVYFNSWAITNGSHTFSLNEWHHVTFIRDNNGNLTTYLNGVQDGSGYQNANISSNLGDLRIGANHNDGVTTLHHDGEIDEVAFWNRELSTDEVVTLHNNGTPLHIDNNPLVEGLTAYYMFNEASGSDVFDYSYASDSDSLPHGIIDGANWIVEGNINQFIYTPFENFFGTDSFSFLVHDGTDYSEAATITINVISINDEPQLVGGGNQNQVEDDWFVAIEQQVYSRTFQVRDIDSENILVSAPNLPEWLTLIEGEVSPGWGTSFTITGTPANMHGGLHDVLLYVDDGDGGFASQSFSIAVELFYKEISGESGFRLLSCNHAGPIFADFLDELWTQGSDGSDLPSASPNVWTYNNGWDPVADLNNNILARGHGFLIYVFADTDFDGDDDLPVMIGVDEISNPLNGTITHAYYDPSAIATNPNEWNLVGNPYGLDLRINTILADNSSKFNSTVYTMDYENPGYRTHNGIVGNIDQGLIKPFDGFWIQADSDGDTLEILKHSIVLGGHINNTNAVRTNNRDESYGSATFTFSDGQYTTNVYLSFTEDGEINLDPADAKQIIPMSPAEHLTSMIYESGNALAINNLPMNLVVDLALDMDVMLLDPDDEGYQTQETQVNMTWDIANLPDGISLVLQNNISGQNINLYGFPSANINLPAKGGFLFPEELMQTYPSVGESQFSLFVNTDITSTIKEQSTLPDHIVLHDAYPNPFNPSTMIRFDLKQIDHVRLNIFDLKGRHVASLVDEIMHSGNHQVPWNPVALPSGVYLVDLKTGKKSFKQKITYIK